MDKNKSIDGLVTKRSKKAPVKKTTTKIKAKTTTPKLLKSLKPPPLHHRPQLNLIKTPLKISSPQFKLLILMKKTAN